MLDGKPTARQLDVLRYIVQQHVERGVTATIRDVAEHLGHKTHSSAQDHIDALIDKGYLRYEGRRLAINWERVGIPIVGRVPAGPGEVPYTEIRGTITPADIPLCRDNHIALRVEGDSMDRAGIVDGSTVIVAQDVEIRPGDIVAAIYDDGAEEVSTLKRLEQQNDEWWLQPESHNPEHVPIRLDEAATLGKVVMVLWRP